IFFNLSPVSLNIPLWQYAILYSGLFFVQLCLSFYAMGGLKLETIMISAASFPIYIEAFFNALLGRDQAWAATNQKDSGYDSPFNYIQAKCQVFLFLLLTSTIGVWKALYTSEFSISVAWSLVTTLIFGYFVWAALKESHLLRQVARQEQKLTTERT